LLLPRWQQAYGHAYRYTGSTNRALPVPAVLEPFLTWVQSTVDPRLNGLLLNWYSASMGHYWAYRRKRAAIPERFRTVIPVAFRAAQRRTVGV